MAEMPARNDDMTLEEMEAELRALKDMGEPVPSISLEELGGRNPLVQELIELEAIGYARDISNRRRGSHHTTDPEVARINAEKERAIEESRQRMEEMTLAHQQRIEEITRQDSSIMKEVEAELKRHQIKKLGEEPAGEPPRTAQTAPDEEDGKILAALQEAWDRNAELERLALERERDHYKKIAEENAVGGPRGQPQQSRMVDLPPDVSSMTTEELEAFLKTTMADLAENLKKDNTKEGEAMPDGLLEQFELATKLREQIENRLKAMNINIRKDPLEDLGDLSNDPYLRYAQAIADIGINVFSHPKVQRFVQAFFPGEDLSPDEVRQRAEGPISPDEEELYNAKRWCRRFGFDPNSVAALTDETIDKLVGIEDITPTMAGLLRKARAILRKHRPPAETVDADYTIIEEEEPPRPKERDDEGGPAPAQTPPPPPPDAGGEAEAVAEPKIQLKTETQPKPIDPEGRFNDLVDPELKRASKKEIPPFAGEVPTREELEALTVTQLREYLRLQGLSSSGRKERLVARALEAQGQSTVEG